MHWTLGARLRATLQALVRKLVWRMDIHPSARIAPTALIDRTWPRGVHIGPACAIGEEAVLLTHDLTRGIYMHTRLGARCQVGPRAIILPGVTIGDDCIVEPGAVVTKDMPAGHRALGNPASIQPRDAAK
jgi:acetyltransferase-like isoleucine patch superfamily enzyme